MEDKTTITKDRLTSIVLNRIGFQRYQLLSSNKELLLVGRIQIEFGSFTFTKRTIPSFPAKHSNTCSRGQNDLSVLSIPSITILISLNICSSFLHFFRTFNAGKYSRRILSQNMFVRACVDLYQVLVR